MPMVIIGGNQKSDLYFATIYLQLTDLDYALIKPNGEHDTMPLFSNLPMISLRKTGKMPPGKTHIMTITGSGGFSYGRLSGRLSYIRFMSSKTFQIAYTIIIDSSLMPVDSGSVVFEFAD
jgi:hypothetical protein